MAEPDLVVEYRIRTVSVAVAVTFMAVGSLVVLPFVPGHPPILPGPYAALVAIATGGALVAWRAVPWRAVFARGWGDRAMYVWSALDIILVTLAMAATGGPRSETAGLYALTTVFFAASYPGAGQVGLFALTCACYGTLNLVSPARASAATLLLRLSVDAMVWFMAAFLARERTREMANHLLTARSAERRAELLSAIAQAASAITVLDSDAVLDSVADLLVGLGFSVAAFCMLEDVGRRFRIAHGRGLPEQIGAAFAASLGAVGLVVERRATVLMEDYGSHPLADPVFKQTGVDTVVAAPVWCLGELVAVMIGGRPYGDDIPVHDVEVLEILASQSGRALENARRFEAEHTTAAEANAAALIDELTGVGNRRQANLLLERLAPDDAVVLLDIDHFKDINDTRGHAAGDQVLASLGLYLREAVRGVDQVARFGGEEFLILMRGAGDGAMSAVERLRRGWQETGAPVSFSAGLARHREGQPHMITVGQADAALYTAKRTGRDRVCEYGPGLEDVSPSS